MRTGSLALIFDGYCGVCTRLAEWAATSSGGRIVSLPSQQPGVREEYGFTREQTDGAAWVVQPGAARWRGAAAINRVLDEIGGPWRAIALAYRVAPLRWLEDCGYEWFAIHRGRFSRFGVTPACERPQAGCLAG